MPSEETRRMGAPSGGAWALSEGLLPRRMGVLLSDVKSSLRAAPRSVDDDEELMVGSNCGCKVVLTCSLSTLLVALVHVRACDALGPRASSRPPGRSQVVMLLRT